MLSAPDSRLVERQPRLPGLRLVLDQAALSAAARLHGLILPEGCEPSYVRFKPGTRCLVGYGPANFRGPPLFYASAFERNSQKLVKALERRVVHSERGPGRIILGDKAVEVCVFPNDDHLRVLIPLADPRRRAKILARLLPGGAREGATDAQPIAYKPERRCAIKYTAGDGAVALLKAYQKHGFDAAFARARHFCARPRIRGTQRLLGVDERRRLLAFEWLPGRLLADELRYPAPPASQVESAGALLAELHASAPDGLPEWSHSGALRRLKEIVEVLADLLPEASKRAAELARRVSVALVAEGTAPVVVHGDFYPKQVLVEGNSVAFTDLDEAQMGPPALDLGNFIAHLHISAGRGEITEMAATAAAEALLAGYATKRSVPSRSVRAFTALALLNVAHEPFRRHRPEWPAEISALLDSVDRLLDRAT